jgi:hypothetical protein
VSALLILAVYPQIRGKRRKEEEEEEEKKDEKNGE